MLDVVEFLERVGQDAQLNRASQNDLEFALAATDLDPKLQEAILAKDQSKLESLLGTVTHAGYLIPGQEPEEPEQEEQEDEESPAREGDVERSALDIAKLLG